MSTPTTAHWRFTARPSTNTLLDVALATAVLAGSLVLRSHVAPGGSAPSLPDPGPGRLHSGELTLIGVVLVACSTVPLVAWRRFPFGVFVVTAAASSTLASLGHPLGLYQIGLLLGPTAALYLLAASRERRPWTSRTTAAVVGLLVAYLVATAVAKGAFSGVAPFDPTGFAWAVGVLAWAVAWLAGERTRLRREQIVELQQRAARAEREAERERRLAAAEERTRIARDLHDAAGHAISVIAVRAGAARLRHHKEPDRSLRALEAIEDLARHTVEEIDQLVGTLREGGSPTAGGTMDAPPGLASLDTLITHHRAAGLETSVATSGTPRTLGGAADQAAYRILQEALTNAARHGTGSARIQLAFGEAALQLSVTNPTPAAGVPRLGGGHGLIGMRERATLLGGSLDTERVDGQFRVHARIPYAIPSTALPHAEHDVQGNDGGVSARDPGADRRCG